MDKDIVMIPRAEHVRLLHIQDIYETMQRVFFAHAFVEPSTREASVVLQGLRGTKKYTPAFLKSLARGLKESTYFKKTV